MRISRIRLSRRLLPQVFTKYMFDPSAQLLSQSEVFPRQIDINVFQRFFRIGTNVHAVLPSFTETCLRQCPFAPRALPRFAATMGISDSRTEPNGKLFIPHRRWTTVHPAGSPRFLDSSFGACRPQSPRTARRVQPPVSSPTVAGFPIIREGRRLPNV